MSDVAQGPGWWQASDGLWYPPERHPGYQPPSAQAGYQQPEAADPGSPHVPPVASPQPAHGAAHPANTRQPLEAKNFIRSLYDFSFSSFITLRVIRILYVLITIVYSLGALIVFAGLLLKHTVTDVIFAIIVVPIGYLIYLTVARIGLEVLMVIFNLGNDVRAMREGAGASSGSPPSGT